MIYAFITILFLAFLAYFRGDRFLFMLSGLGFIVYGFAYTGTSLLYSFLMVLAGIILFIRAFTDWGAK